MLMVVRGRLRDGRWMGVMHKMIVQLEWLTRVTHRLFDFCKFRFGNLDTVSLSITYRTDRRTSHNEHPFPENKVNLAVNLDAMEVKI